MVRIEEFVFGYRILNVEQVNFGIATALLYRMGIPFTHRDKGTLIINEAYIPKAEKVFKEKNIAYSFSGPRGVLNKIKHYEHMPALVSALLFTMIFLLFLSNIVWDIRVDGNVKLTDAMVISELESCGLSIGKLWSGIEKNEVESAVLSNNENISWININRQGTVAYITVKEKDAKTEDKGLEDHAYSNIVATEDCVIEDISVTSGTAMVKAGDVVKAGDILILGVLPESGGNKLCNAEGEVIGRVQGSKKVEVCRQINEKTVFDTAFSGLSIKIFNFPVNIFKTYRNLGSNCDIIKEKTQISFFGICNLPIEVTKMYTISYADSIRVASDDELVNLASYRLSALLYKELSDVDLCSIRTFGEFTDQGYTMRYEFVYSCSVGKEVPIYLEENK